MGEIFLSSKCKSDGQPLKHWYYVPSINFTCHEGFSHRGIKIVDRKK